MKIPMGNQGYTVAQPVTGGVRVTPGAFGVGDAVSDLGQQLTHDAVQAGNRQRAKEEREAAERKAEQKRIEEQARRNKTAATFAQYQVDLTGFSTDISNRLTDGAVTREQAAKEYSEGLAKIRKQHLEGLDPDSRASLEDNLIRFDGAANQRFEEGLRNNAKRERAGNFTGMIESYERLALTDRAGAVQQATAAYASEGKALFGADVAAKQLQQFRERVAVADWSDKLLSSKNSVKGLQQVEAGIQADKDLDPDKKIALTGRAINLRETLLAKAERAEQSRLRTIKHMVDAQDRMILAGFEPSVQQQNALITAAKGTPYEPVVTAQVQFSKQTAAFRGMAPREQEAFLTQFEASVRKNPTPDSIKALDSYRTIASNQQELVKSDPISFAGQKGLAEVQPIDFAQAATLKDQLLARVTLARGMQAQYGAPLKVLTKEEAATLSDFMRRGTSDRKVEMLGALKAALPDFEAYQATMQQIAPDSPVTAWAGSLMNRRPFVENNLVRPDIEIAASKVSQLMLRGESLLNPSAGDRKEDGKGRAMLMPKDKDLIGDFETMMGAAYRSRPDAHQIAMQSSKAVYAALSAEAGDYTGEFNSGRWSQAVNMATGGATDYNGAKVVRPYGLNDSEFKNAVYSEIGRLTAAGQVALSKTMMGRLQLESAGDAKYLMKSGAGYLLGKNGQPVLIDLSGQTVLPQGFKDAAGRDVASQIPNGYGARSDGTQKAAGYFGELQRPDGNISTELSVGVEIQGKETEIPLLVPGLTRKQIDHLLNGGEATDAIMDKAVAHARQRIKAGKSPFAGEGEQVRPPQ